MALVIGSVAGLTVSDANGATLVEAGQTITREMAEQARAEGRLSALVKAVAAAGVQDLRERLDSLRRQTPEGQEEARLDSVDDYAEARRYVGRVAVCDITDIRGRVVIPVGTRITEQHVRLAREHGLLRALIHSASLVQPVHSPAPASAPPSDGDDRTSDATPDPSARVRLPLLDMPEATRPDEPRDAGTEGG